jgi:hypothetical protein
VLTRRVLCLALVKRSDQDEKQIWAKAAARIGITIQYRSIYDEDFRVEYKPIRY